MTCSTLREFIVERARGATLSPDTAGAVASHLESCRLCAARFERERELTLGLKAVTITAAIEQPPEDLERRLLAAFSAHHAPSARSRSLAPAWLAAAAAVLIAAGTGAWMAAVLSTTRPESVDKRDDALAGFVALPLAVGLPQFESGTIVRVDLPVAALPAYGVELVTDPLRSRVQADVLVGQDGQPRAIRFVGGDQTPAAGVSRVSGVSRSRP